MEQGWFRLLFISICWPSYCSVPWEVDFGRLHLLASWPSDLRLRLASGREHSRKLAGRESDQVSPLFWVLLRMLNGNGTECEEEHTAYLMARKQQGGSRKDGDCTIPFKGPSLVTYKSPPQPYLLKFLPPPNRATLCPSF